MPPSVISLSSRHAWTLRPLVHAAPALAMCGMSDPSGGACMTSACAPRAKKTHAAAATDDQRKESDIEGSFQESDGPRNVPVPGGAKMAGLPAGGLLKIKKASAPKPR